MSQQLYDAPAIISINSIDNVNSDQQLITVTSLASVSITPIYAKLIIDNITTNSLSQKLINLNNDDYSLSGQTFTIKLLIPVCENNQYTIKIRIHYSDNNFTAYSPLRSFISAPTKPNIISAYGDSETSIYLSITPQSEVTSYNAILSYIDLQGSQQLDVVENLTTTDSTKQFIELTNLIQTVDYLISIIGVNNNGTSTISNSVQSSTKPQPDPVTNLAASFDNNADITLTWTAPANSVHLSVDHYIIQDGSGNQLDTCSGSVITYTFVQPFAVNQTYSFQVIAVHIANSVSYNSTASNIATISIPEPSEVLNLQSSFDASTLAITLTWSVPANNSIISTTSYNVTVNNGPIQNVQSTSFVWASTSPNSTYAFTVVPLHASYPSNDQVNSINVSIPLTSAPLNFNGNFDPLGNITLTWSAPSNNNVITTTSYNVYNNGSGSPIGTTSSLSFVIPNQLPESAGFHVASVHGVIEGNSSPGVIINIPSPSMPLNLAAIVNTTSPPSVSLSWSAPANNSTINTTSYNVYQNGELVHNVIQPSYNSDQLVSGLSYTFIVKPVIQSTEINSPASVSVTPYQPSLQVASFSSQSRNNSVILNWLAPTDNGGAMSQYYLVQLNQNPPVQVALNTLTYTFNNLTNGTSYNFSIWLVTSPDNGTTLLNGQSSSISASPSGLPIIVSSSLASNTLSATINPNGSNLLSNYEVFTFDSNNIPTIQQFTTPSAGQNGFVTINQLLAGSVSKYTLIVANSVGLVYSNSN